MTFTDVPAWRAAVTAVKVNGVALSTTDYTLTAGVLTILGALWSRIDSVAQSVIVSATGYTDTVAVTFTVAQPTWATLSLGTAAECTIMEPIIAASSVVTSAILLYAKDELRAWIESRFADLQNQLDDEESDLLLIGCIKDVRNLRTCFRYLALSLGLNAVITAGENDLLEKKAKEHMRNALHWFTNWAARAPFELGDYDRAHGTIRLVQ